MKSSFNTDLALLLVRVATGLVLLNHGLDKLTSLDATVALFAAFHAGAAWAYASVAVEILGAILMFVGVATDWAGVALAIDVLAVAVAAALVGLKGTYDLDLVLFMSSIAIALSGPGNYVLHLGKKPVPAAGA